MDENKKYHNPDDDGINNESDNDTYDPYVEYVKDKVHEEQKEEYGDSYALYTDPQMGPEDDRGRSYKPHHRRATNLEKIGFAMSIAALICCCCANIYFCVGKVFTICQKDVLEASNIEAGIYGQRYYCFFLILS